MHPRSSPPCFPCSRATHGTRRCCANALARASDYTTVCNLFVYTGFEERLREGEGRSMWLNDRYNVVGLMLKISSEVEVVKMFEYLLLLEFLNKLSK